MSTSLYLTLVLPASRPVAVLNTIAMVGPRLSTASIASHAPTATATMGTTQTTRPQRQRPAVARASGTSSCVPSGSCGGSSATRLLLGGCVGPLARVPDQARIEAVRGEHGEHDHGAE